ncbi:DUF1521 domain-containing protein [Paraburkholderia sp.]|uniref:DUF1521 domain-containing protein n=1 Tax=Paraburkholderia sp. TaxID=1926495 RepID=UPI002390D0F1|nr:DUF1521 domain-containing protein [Paraburkholderia sp.]MDE1184519.1 DUF1521 domain-containing protein [Paraburkholderia sp.]
MQAAMQSKLSQYPVNVNTSVNNAAAQLARNAACGDVRDTNGRMTDMMGGFSKALYTAVGQPTINARTDTANVATQATTGKPGQTATQAQINAASSDARGIGNVPAGQGSKNTGSKCDTPTGQPSKNTDAKCDTPPNQSGKKTDPKCDTPPNQNGKNTDDKHTTPPNQNCKTSTDTCNDASKTPPRRDADCKDNPTTHWTDSGVCDNKASVDLGNYTLAFNKCDSSMTMINSKNGDTTTVWGDPHLSQHAGTSSASVGMFNGPMTFMLPDDTKVTVGIEAVKNNAALSYANTVTITHGNDAYRVSGLSEQNSAGLSIQRSNDGRRLDAATPDGYTVLAKRDGSGWIDPVSGKQPTAADLAKAKG